MTTEIWAAIGVFGGLCLAGIGIITFWMTQASRLTKAEADSVAAAKAAYEANEKIILLSASFGLYREQIAREYIHREVMREVEERLTQAIERLGDRLDRVLEKKAAA